MRAADRVYEDIRRCILTGKLCPGERLTEELLAERFGASRTPVRSAIVRLAGDGFVEMTPRSGTIVKRRSAGEIADIYDVRALLESAAAGLAARSRTDADLDELKRLQDEMEADFEAADIGETENVETLSLLNKAFHQRILDSSGNATLAESASRLMDIGFLINTYTSFSREEIARSVDEHRKLIDAIRSRDVYWAEAVMRAHILGARNSLASVVEAEKCRR
ncbi:transcriptional regulator, GntR family protein [Fulvimarina pelagi HTCC2506]|uniref:Transcriptional regulator, GntR family protein n=1 Tax=Fulvimarina pelagi HTCC2506 TaxID=314231 RepID=Q0G5J6_9HYPH|nr:transcriptional regulator, GntR family protein [Fulvimarina pelagi HTCC2506]